MPVFPHFRRPNSARAQRLGNRFAAAQRPAPSAKSHRGNRFLTSPTPPQEVVDVFEQLQVGMAPAEVQRGMEFPYPVDIVNGVTVKKFVGTDWCMDVYLKKGWLMKKWLVLRRANQGGGSPGYH
jgi:hypothetical protein